MSKKVLTKSKAAKKAAIALEMGMQSDKLKKVTKKLKAKKAVKKPGSIFQNMKKKGE